MRRCCSLWVHLASALRLRWGLRITDAVEGRRDPHPAPSAEGPPAPGGRPRLRRPDRVVLAAASRALPRPARASFMVSPETHLRWHRELVRRRWTMEGSGSEGASSPSSASGSPPLPVGVENSDHARNLPSPSIAYGCTSSRSRPAERATGEGGGPGEDPRFRQRPAGAGLLTWR
jgi:hypothetical protein